MNSKSRIQPQSAICSLRTVIVDDEPLALDLLESYVGKTPFLQLEGRCGSGVEALALLEEKEIDLLYLDIQMPELNGLELSRLIDNRIRVVFTTAFEQYALEGFRVDALDYLLKPFTYAEFFKTATKALKWFEHQTTPPVQSESIFVKSEYKWVRLQVKQIKYIESLKDYVKIYTEDHPEPILTLMNMRAVEEGLSGDTFVRVHRSFIVNLDKIEVIERNRIVFGKTYIPISDSYREHFMMLLQQRML